MMNKQKIGLYTLAITALLLVAFIILGITLGHAATTSHRIENSLGAVLTNDRHDTNIMGLITGGDFVQGEDGKSYLNLRILPKYSPLFAEQSILFCGDIVPQITEGPKKKLKQGTIVLTYRTAASRLIQGIGCHQLVGVDKVNDGLQ